MKILKAKVKDQRLVIEYFSWRKLRWKFFIKSEYSEPITEKEISDIIQRHTNNSYVIWGLM